MLIEQPYQLNLDEQVYSILEIATLIGHMQSQGIKADTILKGTGIKTQMLDDSGSLVSIRQRLKVFENILNLSDNPALGLHVGQAMSISSYGIWGYALLSCNTLREAIEFAFKYMRLAGPLGKKTFRSENNVCIFDWENVLMLEGRMISFVLELWFATVLSWIQDVMRSPFELSEMRFSYSAPPHTKYYEQVFGCPIYFDCDTNEMRFERQFLDQPTARGNPLTVQMCRELCDKLLLDLQARNGVVKDVQQVLLKTPGYFPDIVTVAERLHMTARTLRRKLEAHGTSYLELITEIRKQLAIQYLRETSMSIEEISEKIGFSDSSNFRTAFKRWTNKTPSMFRNSF